MILLSFIRLLSLSYSSLCRSVFVFIAPAKAKAQSAKVNIKSALVEDIISLDEVKADMTAVLGALKDDFTRNLSIRTSPGTRLTVVAFSLSCFLSACLSYQDVACCERAKLLNVKTEDQFPPIVTLCGHCVTLYGKIRTVLVLSQM